jgi:type II secretory pathway component PulJ
MRTAFHIVWNLFAIIGVIGCVLLATLVTFSYAEYWLSRRRERHLDEIERAEAALRRNLQRAVDQASQRNGGSEL